jgi:hypothetical protein
MSEDETLERIQALWATLDHRGRERHLKWVRERCATCGRIGDWGGRTGGGVFCDACCDEAMAEMDREEVRGRLQ